MDDSHLINITKIGPKKHPSRRDFLELALEKIPRGRRYDLRRSGAVVGGQEGEEFVVWSMFSFQVLRNTSEGSAAHSLEPQGARKVLMRMIFMQIFLFLLIFFWGQIVKK
jgi:hypothetical protein